MTPVELHGGGEAPASQSASQVRAKIAALVDSDLPSWRDLARRYVIIILSTLIVAATVGDWNLVIWLVGYLLSQTAYNWFLYANANSDSATAYRGALALNFLTSSIFTILPLYCWNSGDPMFKVIAVFGLIGQLLFSMSRHTAIVPVLIWDAVQISAMSLFFAWTFSQSHPNDHAAWLIPFLGGMIVIFYVLTLWETYRDQRQLQRATDRRVQTQRLEAVGQLTAGLAHNFNNILTAALGHIELARVQDDPAERDAALSAAHAAALRAARVTTQLLAFARKAPIAPSAQCPHDLIDEIVAIAEERLPTGVNFKIEDVGGLPLVRLDRVQFQNAVVSLLLNAFEASRPGGTITLSMSRTALTGGRRRVGGHFLPAGEFLVVVVADDGSGMSPEVLARAAEPFFSTKAVGLGSGLGLPVARGFAEQCGGALRIDSRAGVGTTVSLFLPAVSTGH